MFSSSPHLPVLPLALAAVSQQPTPPPSHWTNREQALLLQDRSSAGAAGDLAQRAQHHHHHQHRTTPTSTSFTWLKCGTTALFGSQPTSKTNLGRDVVAQPGVVSCTLFMDERVVPVVGVVRVTESSMGVLELEEFVASQNGQCCTSRHLSTTT